jgi:hypothetical protein
MQWRLTREILDAPLRAPHFRPLVLSEEAPRLLLFPGFLSAEETEYLISVAKEKGMERSEVMDGAEDNSEQNVRTSSGAWMDDLLDETVFNINRRIENATGIPW